MYKLILLFSNLLLFFIYIFLQGQFELNVSAEVARPLLEKPWSQRFRTFKSSLRDHLRKNGREVPQGVDPEIWKKIVENEDNPKKQQQNIKNSENRQKLQIPHCLGRCSYAQKAFKKVGIHVYNFQS